MLTLFSSQKHKSSNERAQAIVEFAIVLPILLMILVGILEVGRLIFIYAAVNNASREAVRYASAVGLNDSGTSAKFNDCTGIKGMATRSAFFVPLTITISHDLGPSTTSTNYCGGSMTADNISISSGDRVTVSVVAHYSPMVNLVPISERDFTSISSRTILGILQLAELPGGTASGCTGCGGSPYTPTATNTSAPGAPSETSTVTATATETSIPGDFMTFTPGASPTITLLPSSTATFTPTFTPTTTFTPTSTFTPTATSTPVPGCGNITADSIVVSGKTMYMIITNPHPPVTVQDVQATWNAISGGTGNPKTLTLEKVSLNGQFWTGTDSDGSYSYSIPATTTVTISGYNTTSTIIFTFDKNYQTSSGNSITITLSTPGCETIQITSP